MKFLSPCDASLAVKRGLNMKAHFFQNSAQYVLFGWGIVNYKDGAFVAHIFSPDCAAHPRMTIWPGQNVAFSKKGSPEIYVTVSLRLVGGNAGALTNQAHATIEII
jgi:hypothetical protein